MENVVEKKGFFGKKVNSIINGWGFGIQSNPGKKEVCCNGKPLTKAKMNHTYIIKEVGTENKEMENFLFTLGCYEGEAITVISNIANQYVVVVKDARYSIDEELAGCIVI